MKTYLRANKAFGTRLMILLMVSLVIPIMMVSAAPAFAVLEAALNDGEVYGLAYPNRPLDSLPYRDSVPLYSQPEASEQYTRLRWGSNLIVSGRTGDFYEIRLPDRSGYVKVSDVRLNADNIEYTPIDVLRVHMQGGFSLIDFPEYKWPPEVAEYNITGEYMDFEVVNAAGILWMVRGPDGTVGFMRGNGEFGVPTVTYHSYSEKAAEDDVAVVSLTDGWVNVRQSPGGKVLSIAYEGFQAKMLPGDNGAEVVVDGTAWTHVMMNEQEGYIQSIYLQKVQYESPVADDTASFDNTVDDNAITYPDGSAVYGIVDDGGLMNDPLPALYSSPEGRLDDTIGEVEQGTTVKVLRQEGNWYEVELYDRTGWMHEYEVILDTSSVEYKPLESIGVFTDHTVNLYSFPDIDAPVVAEVAAGEGRYLSLKIIGRAGAYFKVRDHDGNEGFVDGLYRWFLEEDNIAPTTSVSDYLEVSNYLEVPIGIVATPNPKEWLNVRIAPSLSADVIDRLYSGVQVEMSNIGDQFRNEEWARIYVNGQWGYVQSKYIGLVGNG